MSATSGLHLWMQSGMKLNPEKILPKFYMPIMKLLDFFTFKTTYHLINCVLNEVKPYTAIALPHFLSIHKQLIKGTTLL